MKDLATFQALVDSFSRIPGIGVKSAERMAYAILEMDEESAINFANAIINAKHVVHKCPKCGLFAESELCDICSNAERNHHTCIVVSYQKDAYAFERMGKYNGIYHVLGGVISPSKGIGPTELNIDSLINRIDEEGIKELIIATNPNLEGETTALFISKLLKDKDVSITRLAYGLPMGASLDYADSLTLAKALEGRKQI